MDSCYSKVPLNDILERKFSQVCSIWYMKLKSVGYENCEVRIYKNSQVGISGSAGFPRTIKKQYWRTGIKEIWERTDTRFVGFVVHINIHRTESSLPQTGSSTNMSNKVTCLLCMYVCISNYKCLPENLRENTNKFCRGERVDVFKRTESDVKFY